MIAQSIINGIMAGWIYILVALGLTLIMSILGVVNLAHGVIYMLGAYVTHFFCVRIGLNFVFSLIISIFLVGVLGIFIEKFLLRSLRGNVDGMVIMTLGLILIFQTTVIAFYGTTTIALPSPSPGIIRISGIILSKERLLVILLGIVLVSLLVLFIQRTKIGQAMIALSQDREAARLQGINVDYISSTAMFIGCALAAVAGTLVGAIFSLDPTMGDFALMKGIQVIVLGGLGSILGCVISGLILGLVDGVGAVYLSVHIANIIGLAIIMLILLIRPHGIFGHE